MRARRRRVYVTWISTWAGRRYVLRSVSKNGIGKIVSDEYTHERGARFHARQLGWRLAN